MMRSFRENVSTCTALATCANCFGVRLASSVTRCSAATLSWWLVLLFLAVTHRNARRFRPHTVAALVARTLASRGQLYMSASSPVHSPGPYSSTLVSTAPSPPPASPAPPEATSTSNVPFSITNMSSPVVPCVMRSWPACSGVTGCMASAMARTSSRVCDSNSQCSEIALRISCRVACDFWYRGIS